MGMGMISFFSRVCDFIYYWIWIHITTNSRIRISNNWRDTQHYESVDKTDQEASWTLVLFIDFQATRSQSLQSHMCFWQSGIRFIFSNVAESHPGKGRNRLPKTGGKNLNSNGTF